MSSFKMKFLKNLLEIDYTSKGVTRIQYARSSKLSASQSRQEKLIEKSINDFLQGKTSKLDLRIDWSGLEGTEFQRKVWRALARIPKGKTRTYAQIAESIGRPGAARAVGTACGANPVLLAVACHRVVGSNGLGGFSGGGLSVKVQLLGAEGVTQVGRH